VLLLHNLFHLANGSIQSGYSQVQPPAIFRLQKVRGNQPYLRCHQ